ncbi:oxygenase MpaB family protein [Spirulina sp. CCNP1310]|uniref:oxygenase MpaB family protein n=1 Tax=Spirulina sp. CCNP1310 TaxID=3110249 RepID=UPI002B21736D|nr:oxygenase MpaB family protein [Spirulina sp. CCNP1310]MEA5418035.1 oxygenase MpaB family protein [Spirulina sp. CCNP1310]
MSQKLDRCHALQHLDPLVDHCEICRQLSSYEFPWDMTRALEIALFRTFCIPTIATLLDHTAEFHHHGQKRYDDTGIMISLILQWGYDTPQGQAIIGRMNHIHRHFPISNADFLYVLSTFIYEPVRWLDRFGWRPLTPLEKEAIYYFWRSVGEQMEIRDIPPSYGDFEQYNLDYEQQYYRYNPANQRVGNSTVNLFLSWFPPPLRPMIRPLVYAIMDDRMLQAFGFPPPQPWQRQLVTIALRSRSQWIRYLPPRRHPHFYSEEPQRSYPQGYQIQDLGPPKLLPTLNRPQP